MMSINDLKIGDLIFFKAGKYKSCDVIIGFELDVDGTDIHVFVGNYNNKFSKIISWYSDTILCTIYQLDKGIFAYRG